MLVWSQIKMLSLLTSSPHGNDSQVDDSVFFLLSTTPSRSFRLQQVVSMMQHQSQSPAAVVLSVPKTYRRFHSRVEIPIELTLSPKSDRRPSLQINLIQTDAGPITKYFGATGLANESIVIVGDDDIIFGRSFIKDYATAVKSSPWGTVFSAGSDRSCGPALGPCVMGFKGVALRAGMLHGIERIRIPQECFLADDVFITYFFRRVRRFKIRRLQLHSRNRLDIALAWSNDSLNALHRHSRFMINFGCLRALGIDAPSRPSCGSANCGKMG